jgi:hypothetical protein
MTNGIDHYLACCEAEGMPAEAAVDTAMESYEEEQRRLEAEYDYMWQLYEDERAHYEDVRNMGCPGGL